MSNWAWDSVLVAGKYLALVAAISVGLGLVITVLYSFVRRAERGREVRGYWTIFGEALPYIALVALIGGLCGQLGAASRQGVVGELLPAIFSVLGGFAAYYLGAKRDRSGKVAVNTLAFLLGFFVLYNIAATWRQSTEAWDFCRTLYSSPDFEEKDERDDRNRLWSGYCTTVFATWTKQTTAAVTGAAAATP